MPKAKFEIGDRVAWSHEVAAQHGPGSVLRDSALLPATPIGVVVDYANNAKTWLVVEFPQEHLDHPRAVEAASTHEKHNCLTLTQDEIVKVTDDEEAQADATDVQAELDRAKAELEQLRAPDEALRQELEAARAEIARLKGGE